MKKSMLALVTLATLVFITSLPAFAQGDGNGSVAPKPPMAERKAKTTQIHGYNVVDDFFWLREKSNPQVISYLEAENTHTEAVMKPTAAFQEKLYNEMVGHIKETDDTVPYRQGEYFYYSHTEKGKQYPINYRKKDSLSAKEELVFDQNELAKGLKFFSISAFGFCICKRLKSIL